MSFFLVDRESDESVFHANNWHWHAIVEVVRALGVLPEPTVEALHVGWSDHGLTREEARRWSVSPRRSRPAAGSR